jgi:phosphatidylglycerol:prolipoprotein diacylglycerol transferase
MGMTQVFSGALAIADANVHWTGNVDPTAFTVFGLSVRWYGIFITFGMLLALWVSTRRMRRLDATTDQMMTLFLIVIPAAVIAARLGYVVANFSDYFAPFDIKAIVDIRSGGLTILWGVPGGALAGLIWCKVYKKDFIRSTDIILPVALLAQAIGRWGNFMNQELYGRLVTDPSHQWFPLSVFITDSVRDYGWHQATFFYEFVLNLLGFAVLTVLCRRVDLKGFGTLAYAAWYTLTRAILEFFRIEQNSFEVKLGFNLVQVICFVVAGLCVAAIVAMCLVKQIKMGERVWYARGVPKEKVHEPDDLIEPDADVAASVE